MAKAKVKKRTTKPRTTKKEEEKQLSAQEIKQQMEATINKHYGYNVMITDPKELEVIKVPTGIFSLDFETGGGIPRGRGVIYVGEESTFKSSLLYSTAGGFQHICGTCMRGDVKEINFRKVEIYFEEKSNEYVTYKKNDKGKYSYFSKVFLAGSDKLNKYCPGEEMDNKRNVTKLTFYQYDLECSECQQPDYSLFGLLDNEHNYIKSWARKFGVVHYYVILGQAEYSEQTGDLLREWLKTGRLSFIGVDSVDALGPLVEDKKSMEDWDMGVQARVWNKITRAIHALLNKPFTYIYTNKEGDKIKEMRRPNPTICLISQYREKIGAYGDPRVAGGGRGKSFLSATTIDLRRGELEYETEGKKKLYGKNRVFPFEIIKNKVGTPHKRGEIYFDMQTLSVSNIHAYIEYGIRYGLIRGGGAWLEYNGINHNGRKKLACYLGQHKVIQRKLRRDLLKISKSGKLPIKKKVSKVEEDDEI